MNKMAVPLRWFSFGGYFISGNGTFRLEVCPLSEVLYDVHRFYSRVIFVSSLEFAVIDRNKLQAKHASSRAAYEDEFDTNIHGPWMNRWEIVHHNKHTDTLTEGSSWHSHVPGDKA